MGRSVPATLESALDKDRMAGVLRHLVRSRFGGHTTIQSLAVKRLHRRLARYTLQISGLENGRTVEWRIIGKTRENPSLMHRGFRAMQMLWHNGFAREAPDGISIPEPLLYDPDLCLVLMEQVPGVALRRLVKKMAATPDHMRLFAAAIAKVHRCPNVVGAPFRVDDQLCSKYRPAPQSLALSYPDLADGINYIVDNAKRIEASFPDNIFTLSHGDFHLGQVHIHNGRAWILDFDPLTYADPAYDLSEVFVFLKRVARMEELPASYVEQLRDAFLSTYFSIMDLEIARRVPLYEALQHLKRACKCFRVRDESDWEEKMGLLVGQGVACIRAMQETQETPDPANLIELYLRCPGSI